MYRFRQNNGRFKTRGRGGRSYGNHCGRDSRGNISRNARGTNQRRPTICERGELNIAPGIFRFWVFKSESTSEHTVILGQLFINLCDYVYFKPKIIGWQRQSFDYGMAYTQTSIEE